MRVPIAGCQGAAVPRTSRTVCKEGEIFPAVGHTRAAESAQLRALAAGIAGMEQLNAPPFRIGGLECKEIGERREAVELRPERVAGCQLAEMQEMSGFRCARLPGLDSCEIALSIGRHAYHDIGGRVPCRELGIEFTADELNPVGSELYAEMAAWHTAHTLVVCQPPNH